MKQQLNMHSESHIPFSEVPMLLPRRNGKKIHYMTVYRWATRGVRGRILESTLVGGIRYTTIAALNRFLETTNIEANQNRNEEILQRYLQSKHPNG